jgi:hypothetical protein
MKRKHYNIITSFVSYKNIIIYPPNKIFTIYLIYYLLILLRLHTYYLLFNLLNTYYYLSYLSHIT